MIYAVSSFTTLTCTANLIILCWLF